MHNYQKGLIAFGIVALIGGGYKLARNVKTCTEMCKFYDKKFTPAHTQEWTTMQCAIFAKDGTCQMQIPVHHSNYIPDSYTMEFTDIHGGRHTEVVSKNMYDNPPESVIHSHMRWMVCP